jgi:hypothetical protein
MLHRRNIGDPCLDDSPWERLRQRTQTEQKEFRHKSDRTRSNPPVEQQLLDELFARLLQQQILDRIGNTQLMIFTPVIQFPLQANSGFIETRLSIEVHDRDNSSINFTLDFEDS